MDAYDSMVSLLASGGRLPRDYIDRTTQAAGRTAGDVAADLLKRLDVPLLCGCGRRVRVTTTRHNADGGTTRYTRCPGCSARSKVCTRS